MPSNGPATPTTGNSVQPSPMGRDGHTVVLAEKALRHVAPDSRSTLLRLATAPVHGVLG